MALNKTRYGRKLVLDQAFGRVSWTFPTNVYAALFTADPTELGAQTSEITQGGYARVEISDKMADAVLATGVITNSAEIAWSDATEDWPEITHIGIMDASSSGNMIYFGAATTSRTVSEGDNFKIRIGQLTIQER